MTRLKIAVVVGQFPTVSETFIINQLGFLKAQGHKVDILCLGKKHKQLSSNETISKYELMDDAFVFTWRNVMPLHKIKRLFKVASILLRSVGNPYWGQLFNALNPFKYKANALNCNQFFRRYYEYYFAFNKYDVVHVHFGDNAVQIEKLLQYHGQRTIVTFHGYDAHNFKSDFYKHIQALNNVKYTTNTQFLKEKIIKLGFQETKISVLPVGLDTTYFSPEKIAHNTFNLLFIGRFIALKAPLLAIKIVQHIINKGYNHIHLYLIGEGDEFESCENYVKANQLEASVTLLGNRSQQSVKDYMNRSDVFLFPGIVDNRGRCEAQGLVIQEAQAMTLPVIVSDVGGMKEGMLDQKTGFVVKAQDIEAFSQCIITLMNATEKRQQMGKAGRQFVEKNYDSTVLGAQLLKLYQS